MFHFHSKVTGQYPKTHIGDGRQNGLGIGGDVKLDLTPLWLKLQTIKGAFSYGYTNITGEKKHVFDIAIEMVKDGKVNLSEMVTHRFAIDDFEKIIKVNLNKGDHKAIKTVVTFD